MEELRKLQHLSLVSKITSGACWWRGSGAARRLPAGDWRRGEGAEAAFLDGGAAHRAAAAFVAHAWGRGAGRERESRQTNPPPSSPPELENHLGVSDKTMAEFVIDLAKDKKTGTEFGEVRILWEREKQG